MSSIIVASGCGKWMAPLPRGTARRRHLMAGVVHGRRGANWHTGLVEGWSLGREELGGWRHS